jgi:hypothetical protein
MEDLLHQRCFNHLLREAVARFPQCRRYFCRECVTEHEDRVLCAACLNADVDADGSRQSRLGGMMRMMHFVLGTALLWIFFYYLGQLLLSLPSAFHEGTLWEKGWWN